ncbi:MAG: zinc ribbon domain-containing protein [Candidatus Methanofastidiosia archaeon]|jgi:hypothetical protein
MQPEGPFCQSCGMPLQTPEDFGTEADNSKSEKYCRYCYQNGEFTYPDITLEEMIEFSAKGWSDQDQNVTLEHERAQLKEFLPHLERWRT